ncbi:hydantoinase/oxoprolinase N-terminal domain-containing protein [Pararhizobium haloflavum]|uniref:hydantoinase/oxoprolinase N-terminal domain-containing protein n=1 Tax=Pararhizobium haloflavum TaxID=2037914 RepID=UPI000C17DB2C|nr:hydantoinase/oxoprolinase family protein [Pararhizobium haloflavum]
MHDTTFPGPEAGEPISLGLDTGGTYTDAVLHGTRCGVLAKAKALTTRHDLSVGLSMAADSVLASAGVRPEAIALVSLSTTLATNALVEGQAGRVGLIAIGMSQADLARGGVDKALGEGPLVLLSGGHDVHGQERPIDLTPLDDAVEDLKRRCDAVAIAGYFSVRNPAHEIAVRDLVQARTGLPTTCSHELSARLGGPRRALTTVLNAGLITMIDRLLNATRTFLAAREITAPLMVVRGDGALISASEARLRPIETILSGPAASLVGARHLTGLDAAIVSDIGGTTTDVAILQNGRPRLDDEGAVVGGHRTMVEAVAMRTHGLGGDSEVHIDVSALTPEISLGPRRCVPISLAGHAHHSIILDTLARQLRQETPGRLDGRFAMLSGTGATRSTDLGDKEQALLARLGPAPAPLETVLSSMAQRATLERLVQRGMAQIVAFTPSDAMHVLGHQGQWNGEAADLAARLMARRRTGAGNPIAASAEAFSRMVAARLALQSARVVLDAALSDGGPDHRGAPLPINAMTSPLVERALTGPAGIARFSIALDRPIIAIGASAGVHYPAVAPMLGARLIVPEHADVANAVGAVVGQVEVEAEMVVSMPEEDCFLVGGVGEPVRFRSEQEAMGHAREVARREALRRAEKAGAEASRVTLTERTSAPETGGRRQFVEATVKATAIGRPRIATGSSLP